MHTRIALTHRTLNPGGNRHVISTNGSVTLQSSSDNVTGGLAAERTSVTDRTSTRVLLLLGPKLSPTTTTMSPPAVPSAPQGRGAHVTLVTAGGATCSATSVVSCPAMRRLNDRSSPTRSGSVHATAVWSATTTQPSSANAVALYSFGCAETSDTAFSCTDPKLVPTSVTGAPPRCDAVAESAPAPPSTTPMITGAA